MSPRAALEWSLAAVALAAPLSIAGMNLALALLSAAVAWHLHHDERARASLVLVLRSPAFKLAAAGAVWALVASLAGIDPARSLNAWPKELHKLWVFAALGTGLATARREKALGGLACGLAAAGLVGLIQTACLSGGDAGFVRARGFIHAVVYGEITGLGLLGAASYLALGGLTGGVRKSAAAVAVVLAAALLLNQTRAVLIALAAAVPAVALEAPRLRRGLLIAALSLAGVMAVWEVMPTGGRNLRTLLQGGPAGAAHRARLVLWHGAWSMARERPVTGVGPGNFRRAFEESRLDSRLDGERIWGSAHNLYLHQLAERGVPGLALLSALFFVFYAGARRAWRERRDAPAMWALTAAVAFAVMNMTETAWQTEQAATYFLLCWLWGAGPRA